MTDFRDDDTQFWSDPDWNRPDALPHGGTFNNNVLAMSAGLAGFTKVMTPAALDRMNGLGDSLRVHRERGIRLTLPERARRDES